MRKGDRLALESAMILREYCRGTDDCEDCIFDKYDPSAVFFKGCMLNDPDHLPETWELEKIGDRTDENRD